MYQLVLRFARRLAAKPDKTGIMQISNKQEVIDAANDILTKFKKHGVPNEAIKTENDIKVIYNQIKNLEEQTLAKNLKETLTPKKTGDVLDLTGKKIDTSRPIQGGKNVPETEEQILERLNRQNKESVERLKNKKLTDPEDLAHGGRTGTGLNYLLGEDDQNSRVPYGGGGVGKPPITFTLTGGGGYGKNQNIMDQGKSIPGLNQEHYGYGFDLGANIDLPWGLSLEGGAGIGRGSTQTDYKGQPVDWLSGVGETKLGDKWNVGVEGKWPVDFNKLFMKDGGRIGLKDGTKFDPKRRTILKGIATLAALPIIGKYFKWAKPLAKTSKTLTSVPIKDISGMPAWFKPLVNKVIKEGEEIGSSVERQIVHEAKLPNSKTPIHVTQDLNTGNVSVDIGVTKHGFPDGHLGQPVALEYRAGEVIEPTIKKGKEIKGTKTKDEFWVEEAEFTGGHPENIKFEESISEKFGQHGSNFDEVEKFATGKIKKKTAKESIKAERAHWTPEGDYASGGRVPFSGGAIVKGGNWLIKTLRGTREAIKNSKDYSPAQINLFLKQIDDQIKNIEAGGSIPDEVIQTIRSDPKFKSVWQNQKSADPELREMEEVLLEYGTKHATGGRVPLFGGGAARKLWLEFIERQFLKASNEIRQGKGIWQGLTQEQWIKKHDDLTKTLKEWEMGGKKALPKETKEFFGMNDIQLTNKFKIETGQIQASKPTKTLEGIEKTGTINISDPAIADEFSRFMKETDPKGFKDLEQKVELSNLDIKGKKGHAFGGLAGMLGE